MKFRSLFKLVTAVFLFVALVHIVAQVPAGFIHISHKVQGEERP